MDDIKEFRKECDEWLNPLGYTIYSTGMDGRSLVYTNSNHIHTQNLPAIKCMFHLDGGKNAEVFDNGSLKLFLSITTGKIGFKHKDIERYINVFNHYVSVCIANPPF